MPAADSGSGGAGPAQPGGRGRVLIVEDKPFQADLTAAVLQDEGLETVVCHSGTEAIELLNQGGWLAVTLDWSLPDMNGLAVCRHIRETDPAITIMFISGHTDEAMQARAFDAGADDFIVKPFRPVEFTSRLEAHLRKARLSKGGPADESPAMPGTDLGGAVVLRFDDLEIDQGGHEVRIGGRRVDLGPLEFRLVEFLASNAGTAQSRQEILGAVHGIQAKIGLNRVDVLVGRVRAKIGGGPEARTWIATVPGFGYRWDRK